MSSTNMKNVNIRFLILCVLLAFSHSYAIAQLDPNRSTATKIADLLAVLPASHVDRLPAIYQELNSFTEVDLEALAMQLESSEPLIHSKISYALNSYGFYVANEGNADHKKKFNSSIINALTQVKDPVAGNFFLEILKITADDSLGTTLVSFLDHPAYAIQTAQILSVIGGDHAVKTLLSTLAQAREPQVQIALISALGSIHYMPAESALLSFAQSTDQEVQKAAFTSLAQLGGSATKILLQSAAKHADYLYSANGATAQYLTYAQNIAQKGDRKAALTIAKEIFAVHKIDNEVKASALSLLVEINGEKEVKKLLRAAHSTHPAYRQVALELLLPYLNDSRISSLVKNLERSPTDVKVSILNFVGRYKLKMATSNVKDLLRHDSDEVRAAAAQAIYALEGNVAMEELLTMFDSSFPLTSKNIKHALARTDSPQFTSWILNALSSSNEAAQLAALEILADRPVEESAPFVLSIIHLNTNENLVRAAYSALPQVVSAIHQDDLINLLTNTPAQYMSILQQAIIKSTQADENQDQAVRNLIQTYHRATPSEQEFYLGVFAGIKDDLVMEVVETAIDSDQANIKRTAVESMVRLISLSPHKEEQKVLMLRALFERTSDMDLRRRILLNLEPTQTFQALVFAGRFLNDEQLKTAAANTVMGIALNNPHYSGDLVIELLQKVSTVLSGSESSYLREAIKKHIEALPRGAGFVSIFNNENLEGWKGLVGNPNSRAGMDEQTLSVEQMKADELMRAGWYVEGGELHFNGAGDNIATLKKYGDMEMYVDWKLAADGKDGDAGIYLRGSPQVQIWDISRVEVGAEVGSGGLYNNRKHPSKPLLVADNPLGEWNTFHIKMVGDKVTVYLNGHLVTDEVVLENYWNRETPIFSTEQIELQAHGTHVSYRDIYIRELPRKEVFVMNQEEVDEDFEVLFDGTSLDKWIGNTADYIISDENTLAVYPKEGSGGNLYTKEEFGDFIFRFSFRLTPGANNGVGIRTPMEGDAAYVGLEIQVLDDTADIYKNLIDYQYHGSVYGIIPAKRGHLKPVGEWNEEEIYIKGNHIRVTLNGVVIVDGDLATATKNGTLDGLAHPGLDNNSGHIGFLGHGSEVHFKNIRVKRL